MKKIAALMYGNCVPLKRAIASFNTCMDLDSYYLSCDMDWYCTCDNNPHRSHKAEYYSMSLKRWMWINVKALNQYEAAWPGITVMQFGTESTRFEQSIKTYQTFSFKLSGTINIQMFIIVFFSFLHILNTRPLPYCTAAIPSSYLIIS